MKDKQCRQEFRSYIKTTVPCVLIRSNPGYVGSRSGTGHRNISYRDKTEIFHNPPPPPRILENGGEGQQEGGKVKKRVVRLKRGRDR